MFCTSSRRNSLQWKKNFWPFNDSFTRWKILKELKKSEGVITALIDEKLPKKLRSIIPSLKDRLIIRRTLLL